ncbi:DUF7221 family queuine tRNA-ribosyltransferase-like protein [Salinispora arenicola]|uniref:deazapurine DNA modification protein DpdA family protein n=1 Tax=Salinispora arenicola TaxID=168697 RepID=UPI001695AAE1|nr:hypothetical protein [Salinispora arenicola]NIL64719.1 hypothetical protein [Salinispora arenicola]
MTVDTIRRTTVTASGISPRRADELLAFLRKQNLTQWPPPPPTMQERRARWDAHVARFGLGPERVETPWGPVTPWTVSEFHSDAARRATFYLGVGHPHWLNESPVPLFLSATTLSRYRRRGGDFPVRMNGGPWAGDSGDSGADAALILRADPEGHPWFAHPDEYGAMWTRFQEDVGPPDVVGIQDWPCEPQRLAPHRSHRPGAPGSDPDQLPLPGRAVSPRPVAADLAGVASVGVRRAPPRVPGRGGWTWPACALVSAACAGAAPSARLPASWAPSHRSACGCTDSA